MTGTSSNPAVVTSAARAPRRSRSAFVPTVVPCTTSRSPSRAPVSAATRRKPSVIAREGSSGVEGTLKIFARPSARYTKSVNVPPVSTPTRTLFLSLLPFIEPNINRDGQDGQDKGLRISESTAPQQAAGYVMSSQSADIRSKLRGTYPGRDLKFQIL